MLPSPMQTPPIGGMAPMNTTPPMNTMPPMPPMGKMPGMEMNLDPMARQNFNNMMSGIQSQAMMPPMPMHMNKGGPVNPIMALLQGIGQLFGFGGGQKQGGSGTLDDFNRAFAAARRAGKKTFSFDRNGDGVPELYTTLLEGEAEGANEQGSESELDRSKARFFKEQGMDPRLDMNMSDSMPETQQAAPIMSDEFDVQRRGPEDFAPRPQDPRGMDPRLEMIMNSLSQMQPQVRQGDEFQMAAGADAPRPSSNEAVLPEAPGTDILNAINSGMYDAYGDFQGEPIEARLNALVGNQMSPGDVRESVSQTDDSRTPLPQPSMLDQIRFNLTQGSNTADYVRDLLNNLVKKQDDRQEKIDKIQRDFNLLEDGKLGQFGIGMNQGGSVTDAIAKLEKGVAPVQGYQPGGVVQDFFDSVKEQFNKSVPTYDSSKYDSASEQAKDMNIAAGNAMGLSPGSFIGATEYTYPVGDRLLTFTAGNDHKGFGQDKDPDPIAGTPGGAKPNIGGMTPEEAQAYIKSMAPTTYGTTGDYSDLDTFKNYTFGDPNFQFDDFMQAGQIAGYGQANKLASDINKLSGAAEGSYYQEGEDVVDDSVVEGTNNNVADTNTGNTMTSTASTPISPFAQIEQSTVVPSTRTVDSTFNPTFTPLASTDIYNPNFLTDLPDFSSLAIDPSQSSAIDLQKFLEMDQDKTTPKAFTPDTTSITDIMKASGYQQGGAVSPGLNMAIDKFISAYR